MADPNIDKALAYLGTTISTLVEASKEPLDFNTLPNKIPKRSLSGDHINGGTIFGFASRGIKDEATSIKLIVKDEGISIGTVVGDTQIKGVLSAGVIKADVIEAREIKTDQKFGSSSFSEFVATATETLYGKGLLWKGQGNPKQFVFSNPDKFLSSENIDLSKGKQYFVNANPVLSDSELGPTVINSNLQKVGRLKGLMVDGAVSINQYLYFNPSNDRLGLGTEEPNAGLSVCEHGLEVVVGTRDQSRGMIGTFASSPFDIVTDDTARISIGSNGDILLGNRGVEPVQVSVHGKLAIRVNTPDPEVDLHVNGPVRIHGRLHAYDETYPSDGTYRLGDTIWNSNPQAGKPIGWVCVRAGTPGSWATFGIISQLG
jgi:hypothetical protein